MHGFKMRVRYCNANDDRLLHLLKTVRPQVGDIVLETCEHALRRWRIERRMFHSFVPDPDNPHPQLAWRVAVIGIASHEIAMETLNERKRAAFLPFDKR